jgi:predicted dehydrogenase
LKRAVFMNKLHVAVIGLSFGAAFVPIYKLHPNVGKVTICDVDSKQLNTVGDYFGIENRCHSFDQILQDPSIDAVHLVTPIPYHEEQTLKVLQAGKHCACTVPAAITVEGLLKIVDAVKKSGKHYMMMETSVYTRNYLYVKQMLERGEIGNIQFLRGAHYQDMEYWPQYWMGLPPMFYSTHALSPLFACAGRRALRVHCFGSGIMREELRTQYGNPFPIETAIFDLGEGLKAEATRSLFHTARLYEESFNIYGDHSSFEWQQVEWEDSVVFRMDNGPVTGKDGTVYRGREIKCDRIKMLDFQQDLPDEIKRFTVKSKFFDETNPQDSFEAGGGHGGAHPHMVHEFISSIIEDRRPSIDEITAANWTAAGLCAHQSAMDDGKEIIIPSFD